MADPHPAQPDADQMEGFFLKKGLTAARVLTAKYAGGGGTSLQ